MVGESNPSVSHAETKMKVWLHERLAKQELNANEKGGAEDDMHGVLGMIAAVKVAVDTEQDAMIVARHEVSEFAVTAEEARPAMVVIAEKMAALRESRGSVDGKLI